MRSKERGRLLVGQIGFGCIEEGGDRYRLGSIVDGVPNLLIGHLSPVPGRHREQGCGEGERFIRGATVAHQSDDGASRRQVRRLSERRSPFGLHSNAESALRRINQELESRVAARTRQLASVNEELEAFSYSVSHDLRAPLRDIEACVRSMRERVASLPGPDAQQLVEKTGAAVAQMGRLMDDLLQFSRMGREPLRKQRVNLAQVVAAAREQVSRDAGERDVRWSVGQLPDVDADPGLLQVALVNLLDNALKFTRGRSPARIELSTRCDEVVGELVIAVRDNGVGFDGRQAHKLFNVFQRLHTDPAFEGTGIGLASVRRIASRHGGRAWAEGAVDAGATFYLALPTAASQT